ncbi:tRNA pseudouridine(38-40) synthase TruA [Halarsenatibacter silvermanii]|uniref:tRNA pseudouridine synthase A n=1 Tax=Halarsenatibacter silvermanii TaxID=321763 RepID=A0A1G9ND62_9FIRM|nr:tRNA pseudouridine(38-40) synthase TruA [Halarsenatibacter silvermanii]SDL84354.1 tRNA pseudouridine38-40 synthase [Halarsenatibacter silvermanii]
MQRVKLHLAYDGTEYSGWQIQKNTDHTIQEHLERVISRYDPEFKRVYGACRTDAGVHALNQIAHFDMSVDIPEDNIATALNGDLPEDIVCWDAEKAAEDFHSRYDATGKIYRYRIDNGSFPHIYHHRYSAFFYEDLDLFSMQKAVRYLPGKKDFSSFRAKGCSSSTPIREIFSAEVYPQKDEEIWIEVSGSGFLYNMVRIIAGTLIEIGRGKISPAEMEKIIASKSREAAGFTAPAAGLTLVEIFY